MPADVFINSMNVVSPLGFSTDENFANVRAGNTQLESLEFSFSEEKFCVSYMKDELLNAEWDRRIGRAGFTKLEKMSILSIDTIIQESGINVTTEDFQFIYCTTKGNIHLLKPGGLKEDNLKNCLMASMAEKIAGHFGMVQTPMVISNACISGLEGIIIGSRMIASGMCRNIIVCGGDLVSPFVLSGFKSLNALSDQPCRPFDQKRNGINLGEASASILLSAQPSKRQPQVMIKSGFITNDAHHVSAPSRTGQGLLEAIGKTMKNVHNPVPDFICAHGTATLYNDEMEATAFHRADLSSIPVFSLKGYYGHTLGTAGLLETILSIAAILQGKLIVSLGYNECGVSAPIHVVQKNGVEHKHMQSFLKTASGFGGCNAAAWFYLT